MRCELFDVEVERLTFFSTFTQRSLEEVEVVAIEPAAELAPEHRELAEIAAGTDEGERPDVAEVLPVDRFGEVLVADPGGRPGGGRGRGGAGPQPARLLGRRDRRLPRRRRPPPVRAPRAAGGDPGQAGVDVAVVHLGRPAPHLPRPGGRHRRALAQGGRARAGEADPLRLPHHHRLGPARRGRARRLQPGPGQGHLPGRARGAARPGAALRHLVAARGLPVAVAEAGHHPRAPAAAPPPGRPARRAAHRRGRDGLVHRPARRRDRGARGPRHRALHPVRDQDRRRRHARLPGAGVPRRRPGVRAQRPDPQDQPLRGRRVGRDPAVQAGRQAVGAAEAARPPRRRGAGRRADQPVRRAQAPRRLRLPHRLRVAGRVRGRLPLPRDAGPDGRHRGGARRHGGGPPHGPPDLRRRGLRQDRGGAACRLQGGRRRQAGHVPGAHHGAGPAALRHVRRAPARLPVPDRGGLAVPERGPDPAGAQGLPGRARSTCWWAPTACSAATSGPRTWAC